MTGTITAGTKDFKIDDPIAPARKFLYHAAIESDQMADLYTGNVRLNAHGQATVQLPAWFEALNHDFRYQLTAVGAPAPNLYIAQGIGHNRFEIAGGARGQEVSWQVTGIRHDPYALAHPLRAEVEKPAAELGYYLHPRLYGQPETKGVAWAEIHRQAAPPRERKRSARAASENGRARSAGRGVPQGQPLNGTALAALAASSRSKEVEIRQLRAQVEQLQKAQQQMAILLTKLDSRLRGNDKTENASAHRGMGLRPMAPRRRDARATPPAKRAQIARVNF